MNGFYLFIKNKYIMIIFNNLVKIVKKIKVKNEWMHMYVIRIRKCIINITLREMIKKIKKKYMEKSGN